MPDGARIFLVLPTYNECENLPRLIAAVQALPDTINILVVDDNSPDGTGQLADNLSAANSTVQVIHRTGKLGLGTAYTAGFERALAQGAELILTMDADFSHDPKYLPTLLDASRQFDLVIGSRYIPDGGVRDWGPERRMLSRGANAIATFCPRAEGAGLHSRFPMLPTRRAQSDRPGQHPCGRLFVLDRNALPVRTPRLQRR